MPLTDPPQLEPKTKEVWAGVRRPGSQQSQLQTQIDDLRARLTGLTAYQQFLRDQHDFADYEVNLDVLVGDVPEVSESDVDRSGSLLEDTFADWSSYKGDSDQSTGVYGQSSWDDYRSYLTGAGAANVDADEHIQVLQELFDPDATAGAATGTHTDWDAFENDLEANGVSSSEASETSTRLVSVYASVSEFDQYVLAAASCSDVETYLEDNGLTSSEATAVVDDLQTAYGSTLDATARDGLATWMAMADFESWLVDQGVSSTEAGRFVDVLQDEGLTIDDVRALLADDGLTGLLNRMPHSEENSDTRAGIKIWEEPGTTLSGKDAVGGGVSLRGKEIYLERVGDPVDDVETAPTDDISWGSLSIDPQTAFPGQEVRVTATATNTGSTSALATGRLLVDGAVRSSKSVVVDPVGTKTVTFRLNFGDVGTYEIAISGAGPSTLVVNHTSGL